MPSSSGVRLRKRSTPSNATPWATGQPAGSNGPPCRQALRRATAPTAIPPRARTADAETSYTRRAARRARSRQVESRMPGAPVLSENADRYTEVFSARKVTVFEMGEHECSPRNLGDLAGADGDVLEGAPAPSEQREAALAQAAHGP